MRRRRGSNTDEDVSENRGRLVSGSSLVNNNGSDNVVPSNVGEGSKRKGRKRKRKDESSEQPKKKRKLNKVRGLRFFSKLVLDKVREKRKTTYNEVANALVDEHAVSSGSERKQEEKNIRRRVYDALNVLVALEIVSKNRKEIHWRGYPMNFQHEYDHLQKQKESMEASVAHKKVQVAELVKQRDALSSLYRRNREEKSDGYRVDLPFIIVHTGKKTVIECQMDATAQEVFFNFSQPFEIHDDNEILQRLFDPKNQKYLTQRRQERNNKKQQQQIDTIQNKKNTPKTPKTKNTIINNTRKSRRKKKIIQ